MSCLWNPCHTCRIKSVVLRRRGTAGNGRVILMELRCGRRDMQRGSHVADRKAALAVTPDAAGGQLVDLCRRTPETAALTAREHYSFFRSTSGRRPSLCAFSYCVLCQALSLFGLLDQFVGINYVVYGCLLCFPFRNLQISKVYQ